MTTRVPRSHPYPWFGARSCSIELRPLTRSGVTMILDTAERFDASGRRVKETARTKAVRRRKPVRPRRPAPHVVPDGPAVLARTPDAVLDLQRTAGNRAVSSLIRPVQRVGGWTDPDPRAGTGLVAGEPQTGWNAEEHAVGNIRRIPIDGLVGGLQASPSETKSAQELTDEMVAGKVKGAARPDVADQAGRGRAIALRPQVDQGESARRRVLPPPRPHREEEPGLRRLAPARGHRQGARRRAGPRRRSRSKRPIPIRSSASCPRASVSRTSAPSTRMPTRATRSTGSPSSGRGPRRHRAFGSCCRRTAAAGSRSAARSA